MHGKNGAEKAQILIKNKAGGKFIGSNVAIQGHCIWPGEQWLHDLPLANNQSKPLPPCFYHP